MRVLLSTIGSRGDVQPLVALAVALRARGADVHLCVPPDFQEWIDGLGFRVTPIGPELRSMTATPRAGAAPPSPEQLRQLASASVGVQFQTLSAVARGCDVIVGATALQIAAPSVAEQMGIRYVFAAYCAAVLPSPLHAPPPTPGAAAAPGEKVDHRELWDRDGRRFTELFGAALDAYRTEMGLPPVADVRGHVFTSRPWLAADPKLGPWPEPSDSSVVQTGAWLLPDERPLTIDVQRFLDEGEPPIYFGFGSMRAAAGLGRSMIEAARALGRRAIVARGWGDVEVEVCDDALSIGEVNQQALFDRVAAAVHHGGAGTTTAAARSGAPQVIVPQLYDQHYWAGRVRDLGIGSAHSPGVPSVDSLATALEAALTREVRTRAASIAPSIRTDGAEVAAQHLLDGT